MADKRAAATILSRCEIPANTQVRLAANPDNRLLVYNRHATDEALAILYRTGDANTKAAAVGHRKAGPVTLQAALARKPTVGVAKAIFRPNPDPGAVERLGAWKWPESVAREAITHLVVTPWIVESVKHYEKALSSYGELADWASVVPAGLLEADMAARWADRRTSQSVGRLLFARPDVAQAVAAGVGATEDRQWSHAARQLLSSTGFIADVDARRAMLAGGIARSRGPAVTWAKTNVAFSVEDLRSAGYGDDVAGMPEWRAEAVDVHTCSSQTARLVCEHLVKADWLQGGVLASAAVLARRHPEAVVTAGLAAKAHEEQRWRHCLGAARDVWLLDTLGGPYEPSQAATTGQEAFEFVAEADMTISVTAAVGWLSSSMASAGRKVANATFAEFAEQLGDAPDAWDLALRLLRDGFDGTFEDLVAVAAFA